MDSLNNTPKVANNVYDLQSDSTSIPEEVQALNNRRLRAASDSNPEPGLSDNGQDRSDEDIASRKAEPVVTSDKQNNEMNDQVSGSDDTSLVQAQTSEDAVRVSEDNTLDSKDTAPTLEDDTAQASEDTVRVSENTILDSKDTAPTLEDDTAQASEDAVRVSEDTALDSKDTAPTLEGDTAQALEDTVKDLRLKPRTRHFPPPLPDVQEPAKYPELLSNELPKRGLVKDLIRALEQ